MLIYALKINLNIYQKNKNLKKDAMSWKNTKCKCAKWNATHKNEMQCVKLNVQHPNNSCT